MGDEGGCVLEGRESCEGEKKWKGLPSGWGIARRGPKPMESWKPVRMKGTVLGGEHLCVRMRVRVCACTKTRMAQKGRTSCSKAHPASSIPAWSQASTQSHSREPGCRRSGRVLCLGSWCPECISVPPRMVRDCGGRREAGSRSRYSPRPWPYCSARKVT